MNTQELIDSIKDLPYVDLSEHYLGGAKMVNRNSVIDLVKKLEGPQKVTIPQFVAEWIESNNEIDGITYMLHLPIAPSRIVAWIDSDRNNARILARALLDGYEVEREKVYTVKIPNPHHDGITVLEKVGDDVIMSQMDDYLAKWQEEPEYQLTESEIRKDFEWAWQAGFAKEVE